MSDLRSLPSVDRFLKSDEAAGWIDGFGRPLVVDAIREVLDQARDLYRKTGEIPGDAKLFQQVGERLKELTAPTLKPVINATGVILHTNLGRAPLSKDAIKAVQDAALDYSTLEYDLSKGTRGSRLLHAEELIKRLTGADAALVVNNNASAVLLSITGLSRRRAVVIARSQLVEIGGGFRVPDVMKQSGARLIEIGTTNRVHLSDYESALEQKPALFLRAHRSNFTILGFTSEPSLAEIAQVAHQAGIPVIDDLGSGSLLDTEKFGLGHEPTVQESLLAGADLVCFSGDKLLGGPQAGIITGRAEIVNKLKKHPLARAVRADKLCLAALSATLLHYLKDEAERKVPVWQMISTPVEAIRSKADGWAKQLGIGEVIPGESTIGGGSLPGKTLPTFLLAINSPSPNLLLERLRQAHPPVIARVQNDQLVLDPRTVLPDSENVFLIALSDVLTGM